MASSCCILGLTLAIIYIVSARPLSGTDNAILGNGLEDGNDNVNPQEMLFLNEKYDNTAIQDNSNFRLEDAEFDEDQTIGENQEENRDEADIMSQKSDLNKLKKEEKKLNKMMKKTKRMDKDASLLLKKAHYVKHTSSPTANMEDDIEAAAKEKRHKEAIDRAASRILKKIEEMDEESNEANQLHH